jgi:hypothetical protein
MDERKAYLKMAKTNRNLTNRDAYGVRLISDEA